MVSWVVMVLLILDVVLVMRVMCVVWDFGFGICCSFVFLSV